MESGPPDAKKRKLSINEREGNILPKELLLKIFGYLSKGDLVRRVGLVCKSWKELTMDSSLWHELTLAGNFRYPDHVILVIEGMTQLKKLRALSIYTCDMDQVLDALSPQLETLHLEGVTFREDPLNRIAERCVNLKQVYLTNCHMERGGRHLLDIFSSCPKLQSISLNGIKGMRPIDPLTPRNWGRLEEVDIDTDLPSADAEVKVLTPIVGSQLVKLTAMKLLVPRSYIRISQCSNLQQLHLMKNTSMTDSCLLNELSSLKNLHKLSLRNAAYITPAAMCKFMNRPHEFRNLMFLDLSSNPSVENSCLSIIGVTCVRLAHLVLERCDGITLDGMKVVVRSLPHLKSLIGVIYHGLGGVYRDLKALRPRLRLRDAKRDEAY